MPIITVGDQQINVAAGTRLVNALEDAGVHIGHRCGGKSRCTTCRVQFLHGEPAETTPAEQAKLAEKGYTGQYRLSCQIRVTADMHVVPQMTLESVPDWTDTGPRCADVIEPDPLLPL